MATAPFKPATVTAPPDAFQRSVRILVEKGETIDQKDESAGVITTQWQLANDGPGDSKMELRWTVSVASGSITVTSQCRQTTTVSGPVNDETSTYECNDRQPEGRTEAAKALADAIVR